MNKFIKKHFFQAFIIMFLIILTMLLSIVILCNENFLSFLLDIKYDQFKLDILNILILFSIVFNAIIISIYIVKLMIVKIYQKENQATFDKEFEFLKYINSFRSKF